MLLGMATIGATEATDRLKKLSGWNLEGNAIRRTFTFPGFPGAIAFLVRLGFEAEAADHHPDVVVNYKRVTLTYTTHSDGGLTEKDFAGASTATGIAASMGGT
jgi:4a-hydroxytetrahydrobiopterin dehydratase